VFVTDDGKAALIWEQAEACLDHGLVGTDPPEIIFPVDFLTPFLRSMSLEEG